MIVDIKLGNKKIQFKKEVETMTTVRRINLKPRSANRNDYINFCLNGDKQYVAIGWSGVYDAHPSIKTYEEYYAAVKEHYKKVNHAHNAFRSAKSDDLFWTRDLDGNYWICRVIGNAISMYIPEFDIGAVIPVKAHKYGLEVPGQIKASFNRKNGGTCETISDRAIIEYSKSIYNELSGSSYYSIEKVDSSLLDTLPDFDLEELVISYIQLKEDYYLLSNSIANNSTTIHIECEFIGRDKNNVKKAVVQVKGGTTTTVNAAEYIEFDNKGYTVFLYAPQITNSELLKNGVIISRQNLIEFYNEYKPILPFSITKWENILN